MICTGLFYRVIAVTTLTVVMVLCAESTLLFSSCTIAVRG